MKMLRMKMLEMKPSTIANKIIKKNFTLLSILKNKKRDDPNLIALMLCELYFSSPLKRLIEYLVWNLLTIIKSKKRYYISVGISQIQINHWISHDFVTDKGGIKNLSQFLSVTSNYDLMNNLFQNYDFKNLNDSKLIAIYRGEARAYHLNLFTALKEALTTANIKACQYGG